MAAIHTTSGSVHVLRPLEDSRWDDLVRQHPQSSVFHTGGWLEALRRTYGYSPTALTTSPSRSPLQNAWLFCPVDSWLTGRRWVSLPFSDHCQPLTSDTDCVAQFLGAMGTLIGQERLRYFEIRPLQPLEYSPLALSPVLSYSKHAYCFHCIDLTPDLQTLFHNCHKDSIQRKILRAERERLRYEEGQCVRLLDAFYALQVLTRSRHGLPPQPREWFRNLVECMGEAAKIRVAYRGTRPVAALLTIRHKNTMVYKYGCSDAEHNNVGGTQLLLWKTIEEAKEDGMRIFDLGRSDFLDQGLITFKDRWGSSRNNLTYSRFTSALAPKNAYSAPGYFRNKRVMRNLFSHMPRLLARTVGEALYKHVG